MASKKPKPNPLEGAPIIRARADIKRNHQLVFKEGQNLKVKKTFYNEAYGMWSVQVFEEPGMWFWSHLFDRAPEDTITL